MQGLFDLEKETTKLKSVWGGKDVIVTYTVSHIVEGVENLYTVDAKLRGLNDFTPEIHFQEVTQNLTNNAFTVDDDILLEELNACNSSQLMGAEAI